MMVFRRLVVAGLWLFGRRSVRFTFGVDDGDKVIFEFTDSIGLVYAWDRTPDQVRELAWKMIDAADELEAAIEKRRWSRGEE